MEAICVMSLCCWLRVALILLVYATEAINSIAVMTRNDKYSPASRLVFSAVLGIKISFTLTQVLECHNISYKISLLTLEVSPFLRHLEKSGNCMFWGSKLNIQIKYLFLMHDLFWLSSLKAVLIIREIKVVFSLWAFKSAFKCI